MLTKMDGDARGGAALSIYGVTKKPIKYIGVGEKSDALEEFHPDRMAGRILQQGDIVSLVEKAQDAFDADEAKKLEKKVRKEGMDLEDFLTAMKQIEKLGPAGGRAEDAARREHARCSSRPSRRTRKRMKHIEAIVLSMTAAERKEPAHHERLAPRARRQGQRPADQRGEPAARAVPRDAEDDEEGGGGRRWECHR